MASLRKIGCIGNSSKYITLPKEWGDIGDKALVFIISDRELKLKIVSEEELLQISDVKK